ncbi:MAG: hypothetical protein BWY98_00087 [Tenericutes bacterium ADurb.BinA155]|jgi:hypothetical protein|nr:MAG: hypothetical protein BWY98_00087 [Tenericutes bacterium ADurb.BinA155]
MFGKKKEAPKKAEPKKAAPKKAAKKADSSKVYHVSKRASDGKWTIKFAGGQKSIKLYDTKEAAMADADKMAKNQGGIVLAHASKGAHAGKIRK